MLINVIVWSLISEIQNTSHLMNEDNWNTLVNFIVGYVNHFRDLLSKAQAHP